MRFSSQVFGVSSSLIAEAGLEKCLGFAALSQLNISLMARTHLIKRYPFQTTCGHAPVP